MKKILQNFKTVGIVVVIVTILSLGYYFGVFLPKKEAQTPEQNKQEQIMENKKSDIVLYGEIRNFSTSGDIKFDYYDIEQGKALYDENKPWFWGYLHDNQIDYVSKNPYSVFKITGKKEEDDCGYTEGICLEDISVNEIAVVDEGDILKEKKALLKNFPSPDAKYKGSIAEINFSHNSGPVSAYIYRTRLRNAITYGPNFAGHYAIETIGCGTECIQLAIIDVKNGNVHFFPDAVSWVGNVIFGSNAPEGIIYSIDSNLLIIQPYENREDREDIRECWKTAKIQGNWNYVKQEECYLDKTRYFLWKNDKLSEISETEVVEIKS